MTDKHVIIIIDGAADVPLEVLGGKTPLEAARIPNMDKIASQGILGTVRNAPLSLPCGSDVAIMAVLGYNPEAHYSGRAPIEAVAKNVPVAPTDWVFRCNIVTVRDGKMIDHSAENILQKDAEKIISLMNEKLGAPGLKFYPGVSYRNTLVVSREMAVETTPPHNILDQEWKQHLPKGDGADLLIDLIKQSQKILAGNAINPLATSIWFWGEGRKPHLENFFEKRGVRGAAITAVDLVRGLAILAGWDVIEVPGATAYFDTNYKGKGEYAIRALENHDLVCVHVEAPDEAGHKGDVKEKIRALENIDTHVIGPILSSLERGKKSWSMLVLPDHPTPCAIRTHTHEPVIFAALASDMVRAPLVRAGAGADPAGDSIGRVYTEASAVAAGFFVEKGYTLMDRFLSGKWK